MIKKIIKKIKYLFTALKYIKNNTIDKYRFNKRRKVFLKNGLEALSAFDKAMKELNINYWLQFGTLLGAIREKGFISHDFDIDVGAFINSYSEENEKIFNKYGLKKIRHFLIDDGNFGREETYSYNGVNIDIFYFHLRDSIMFCHAFALLKNKSEKETIEENGGFVVREISYPYKGFKTIKFYGKDFMIVSNPDEHLVCDYGKNYMIPDPNYCVDVRENVKYLDTKVGILTRFE